MEVLSRLEAECVSRFFEKGVSPHVAVTKILEIHKYYVAAAVKRDVERLWWKDQKGGEKQKNDEKGSCSFFYCF